MKKFLKVFGILIFGAVAGILLFLISITLISYNLMDSSVIVPSNSVLVLDFSGEISEKPVSNDFNVLSKSSQTLQLIKIIDAIKQAKFDDKIKAIIINGDFTYYDMVHIEEISKALIDFKSADKKVYAWFSRGSNSNYILSTFADEIYMPDTDSSELTLTGYSIIQPYLKGIFENFGIDFEVIHVGSYKGSNENYTRYKMSDNVKENYSVVFNDLYDKKISLISENRNISKNTLRNIISNGRSILIDPDQAISYNLIDGKMSYRNLLESINTENKVYELSISDYIKNIKYNDFNDKIAVLYAEGIIHDYYSNDSYTGGSTVGAKSFIKELENLEKNSQIKAIVIRVNSPGGSGLASELIFQAIENARKVKPVYVSMGPIAASGGYYISSPADKIFASKFTITGSIGVVFMLMNFENFSNKYGINFEVVKGNRYDDIFTPTRRLSDFEKGIIQNSMMKLYNEFTSHVKDYRKIENINNVAQGRIWTGAQSLNNNLVDENATLSEVIKYAAESNNIEKYTVVSYPKPLTFFEKIMQDGTQIFYQNSLTNFLNEKDIIKYNKYLSNKVLFYDLFLDNVNLSR